MLKVGSCNLIVVLLAKGHKQKHEYRFTEYEYDLDTLVCGVQREVSKSTLKSLNKTF